MHTFARLAAVAALTLTAGAASAAPTYLLQRTDGPITVDGVLDESTWALAAPTYLLQRTDGPITVDGVLDETTWAKAVPTSPLRDLSGGPSDYAADIRMAYDDTYLYVAARLPAKRLRATLTQRDSVIYRDDDFEVFIDPFARARHRLGPLPHRALPRPRVPRPARLGHQGPEDRRHPPGHPQRRHR